MKDTKSLCEALSESAVWVQLAHFVSFDILTAEDVTSLQNTPQARRLLVCTLQELFNEVPV